MTQVIMVTTDYSQNIGTSPVWIFPPNHFSRPLYYMRIWNVSPAGGPTIWLSRNGQPAAINGAGSFPLLPQEFEDFRAPQAVPTNALSAVCSDAGAPLTVEVA